MNNIEKTLIFIWVLIIIGFITAIFPLKEEVVPPLVVEPTWEEIVKADKILNALALCESGMDPKIKNSKDSDGEAKYGLFQFDADTWIDWTDEINKEEGYRTWDIWNPDDQLKVTQWALANDLGSHWGCPTT